MPIDYPELDSLPPDEKLKLAVELWKEATSDEAALPVHPEIVEILEARLRHYEENPETGVPWEEVKKRILKTNG